MICVLFGAGAEQGFGLSGGEDFARKVLGLDASSLNDAIEDHYKELLKNEGDNWYPNFVNTNWKTETLLKAALSKKYLDESFDTKTEYESKIKNEIKETENDTVFQNNIIDSYSSYMGIIDGIFHTLINPKVLGPKRFWRVVICYSRAYAYLIGKMCQPETVSKDLYYRILSDWAFTKETMRNFADLHKSDESYYSIIKEYSDIKVVTTNYTNLCETISGIKEDDIAYVHGKFGWFESPKELTTYDAFNEPLPSTLVFPYIFIQSGIKPIVDHRQLAEYSKMLKFVDEADAIFVLGYRINLDDNHINSILKTAALKGKKLIYFDFDDLEKTVILRRLRLKDCSNLRVVKINADNSFENFERELKKQCKNKN